MNFLVIKQDKVQNVIVAETQEIAEAVSPNAEVIEAIGSEPWINWTRSGGVWTPPEEPKEPEESEE
jgi:hypothetical protein